MGLAALNDQGLALSRLRVVGLVGYLWPGGLDDPAQPGARQLPPAALDLLRAIGSFVTSK